MQGGVFRRRSNDGVKQRTDIATATLTDSCSELSSLMRNYSWMVHYMTHELKKQKYVL